MPNQEWNRDLKSTVKDAAQREAESLGLADFDFVMAALIWQSNWIGLTGAFLFAVVSGSGLPLVMAAGLELMYLAAVPQSSAFRRLVRSWKFAEQKRRIEYQQARAMLDLPPST